MSILGVGVNLS